MKERIIAAVVSSLADHRASPWIAMGLYTIALLATLPDFSVSWDEPGWFDYGQRSWEWVLGDSVSVSPRTRGYERYGGMPALTATASHWLLSVRTGLMEPDSARHLSNVVWTLVGVAALIVWANATLGSRGALFAVLLWTLWIRLWPHAHNNISDLPGASAALWAAWGAWRISAAPRPRVVDYALWGLLMGIAYSARAPNLYFVGLWITLWAGFDRFVAGRRWPALSVPGIACAFAAFVITVKVSNPFLWHASVFDRVFHLNPAAYLMDPIGDVPVLFRGQLQALGSARWSYAAWTFAISTPLLVLALIALGIGDVARRIRKVPSYLTLWVLLGVGAIAKHLTGGGNYDGVRHFAEAFGPLTLIATHGALQLARLRDRFPIVARCMIDALLVAGVALPIWTAAHLYPYLTGYFNPLAGSLDRAWRDYEADYWGQGLQPAARWLDLIFDLSEREIYAPLAPNLLMRQLPSDVNVIRLRQQGDQLERAPDGSLLVVLNRVGLLDGRSLRDCPNQWERLHAVGPESVSTPAVFICWKLSRSGQS